MGFLSGLFGSTPPPPDYTSLTNAANNSQAAMGAIGKQQQDAALQGYTQNMAADTQVANAQLGLMNQAQQQGNDYYNFYKQNVQPLQQNMLNEANVAPAQMENEYASRAAADSRAGQAQNQNQLMREGLRYGWSPQKIAQMSATSGVQNASATAGAMQQARLGANQLNWQRQMDASNMGTGMMGASQSAYGLAGGLGGQAVSSTANPSSMYQQGLGQAANTIGTGYQLQTSGLGNVMNAQNQYNQMVTSANNATMGALGSVLGTVGGSMMSGPIGSMLGKKVLGG